MADRTHRKVTQIVKNALERRDHDVRFAAILGNANGTVLTGVAGMVYATKFNGEVIVVLNRRVPNRSFLSVVIGYDSNAPGVLQVLYARDVYGAQDSGPLVPDHTHTYAGGNADFVEAARIQPLLVLPYDGFQVQVFGGVIQASDGSWLLVQNQIVDLSAYQPASAAKWVVLEVDDTGAMAVLEGSEVATKEVLTVDDIPASSNTPIVAIQLYEGQTAVQRDPNGINDFVDLRLFATRSATGSDHNQLSGLQGGTTDEYYHLTSAEYTGLGDIQPTQKGGRRLKRPRLRRQNTRPWLPGPKRHMRPICKADMPFLGEDSHSRCALL